MHMQSEMPFHRASTRPYQDPGQFSNIVTPNGARLSAASAGNCREQERRVSEDQVGLAQVHRRRRRRPNLFRCHGLGRNHHASVSQIREDSRWSRL